MARLFGVLRRKNSVSRKNWRKAPGLLVATEAIQEATWD
jgi:hypothetical protein